ncbi:hypothetical protein QJS66_23295 (plasmid) [Kocuria rhizophila]|nr:hypothetical protein QJS66_23295 [Kocuria rhizophila]
MDRQVSTGPHRERRCPLTGCAGHGDGCSPRAPAPRARGQHGRVWPWGARWPAGPL